MESVPRIELGWAVLQTAAWPLGYTDITFLVRGMGLEPTRLTAALFKNAMSAIPSPPHFKIFLPTTPKHSKDVKNRVSHGLLFLRNLLSLLLCDPIHLRTAPCLC
jgi:hypothetical protein